MDAVQKTVKEVFRDYDSGSFELNAAQISSINFYKKKSELELGKILAYKCIELEKEKERYKSRRRNNN